MILAITLVKPTLVSDKRDEKAVNWKQITKFNSCPSHSSTEEPFRLGLRIAPQCFFSSLLTEDFPEEEKFFGGEKDTYKNDLYIFLLVRPMEEKNWMERISYLLPD